MNSLWKDKCSLISLTDVAGTTGPVPFTEGMLLYWNIEATLQEAFDLRTREGQVSYAAWLVVYQNDLPGLYIFSHAQRFSHFAESVKQSIHFDGAATSVPAILYAVWKTREDLCNSFDLSTEIGRTGLCGNLLLNACSSTPFIWSLKNYLTAPIPEVGGLPRIIYAIWLTRNDLKGSFDITREDGRAGLLGNLLLREEKIQQFLPYLKEFLTAPVSEAGGLPRILYAIWLSRSDLQEHFPFKEPGVKQKIFLWAKQYGYQEHPWLEIPLERAKMLPEKITLQSDSTPSLQELPALSPQVVETPAHAAANKGCNFPSQNVDVITLPHGVNLFGYAFAPSGLGMDLRMVATALEHAQVPFCVINSPIPTPSSPSELTFLAYKADKPRYDTTIFCLPCGEIYRALCMLGESYFAGQYLIGQMPWEFASWPPAQVPVLHLLHEAWCLSTFIQKALSVCPIPIRWMPRPVAYEPQPALNRASFGLTEETYIFLFMWDGLSYSSRKNPEAVVGAFKEAFEPAVRDVRLLLKTQHSFFDKCGDNWRAAVGNDDRIQIMEASLTQQQIWGLYAACDAYVALHRSEGFGLSLAEAMLAEKPVIASAYSGNLDFCTHETALCVPGTQVPVPPRAYPLAEGQKWFDADISKAAIFMRYCYENRHKAAVLARAGHDYIQKHYGLTVCAKHYAERLHQIWNQKLI